jgi:branched-chain amino acid transport system ATP-binding protein
VGLSPRQILAQGIVQVPQSHSLFPSMTVEQNVRLGAYTLSDTALVNRRLADVRDLFPIVKQRARDRAGSLSGGQQRLVEFARCLMLDPAMVLLDEPSMGLDPKTLRQVFEMIILMRDSGHTVLLVEQNARSGLRIASHGVVMESGVVRLEGNHTEILENPEIGALYLGGVVSRAPAS